MTLQGNWNDFWSAVLTGLGAPVTQNNINILNAWASGEGMPQSSNNPLASTTNWTGATYFNTFGPGGIYHVKNYPTRQAGEAATIATLQQPYAGPVVALLQQNAPPSSYANNPAVTATFQKGWYQGDLNLITSGNVVSPSGTSPPSSTTPGAIGGTFTAVPAAFDPSGIGSAISTGIASLEKSLSEVLLSGAFAILGLALIVVGGYVLARPQINQGIRTAAAGAAGGE